MAEFTPITTQEQFDTAISDRLRRERETAGKRYEGWTSPEDLKKLKTDYEGRLKDLQGKLDTANSTISGHAAELAARDQKIAQYETDSVKTRVAMETGLPYSMAGRLTGNTEEAIRADAQSLLEAMGPKTEAPMATGEVRGAGSGADRSALRALAAEL